ncbi:hypothetical protein CDAR_483061 [Caerostris darwini]|uniref:Uncharacterized protein n=1 Tax=Caerostris darwini TaxID=1538125 RepID=A0AAV4V582_9ARAC|nr:hypothetical protein CDAR_483061 [Caerostris darwini]
MYQPLYLKVNSFKHFKHSLYAANEYIHRTQVDVVNNTPKHANPYPLYLCTVSPNERWGVTEKSFVKATSDGAKLTVDTPITSLWKPRLRFREKETWDRISRAADMSYWSSVLAGKHANGVNKFRPSLLRKIQCRRSPVFGCHGNEPDWLALWAPHLMNGAGCTNMFDSALSGDCALIYHICLLPVRVLLHPNRPKAHGTSDRGCDSNPELYFQIKEEKLKIRRDLPPKKEILWNFTRKINTKQRDLPLRKQKLVNPHKKNKRTNN